MQMPTSHYIQSDFSIVKKGIGLLALTLILAFSARIQIPLGIVKASLQPCVVLLIGLLFSPQWALAIVGAYLLEGALGLPVFQSTPERGSGLAYMVGPTGGYLVGFLVSSMVVALLRRKREGIRGSLLAATFGYIIMLGCGAVWLSYLIGWDLAYKMGVLPFLTVGGIHIGLAVVISLLMANLKKTFVQ